MVPQVGMKFQSVDEAWKFWEAYGSHTGFEVRKRYTNKRKYDGKARSCRYVCAKEGHGREDKRDHLTKCPRAETRCDCEVRMSLVLDQEVGNYRVTDLILEHNHILHTPETFHLMVSQRNISELQAFEIEVADEAGIRPKDAHELASMHVGGSFNLTYTCRDQKNYLRSKRQREMAYGEAGSMLRYFESKKIENPSFQHVLQKDCDGQIANIFWADAKMIVDYAHFGDAITFDTTFGTNKESRPFGVLLDLIILERQLFLVPPLCMMKHLNLSGGFLIPFSKHIMESNPKQSSQTKTVQWVKQLDKFSQKHGMDFAHFTYHRMLSNIYMIRRFYGVLVLVCLSMWTRPLLKKHFTP